MLTSEQRAAVEDDGHQVVIAGAGSGKTLVLVEKVRRWLAEGIPPSAIIVLTFTRRAALNFKQQLGDDARSLDWVGTIHGLAFRNLRAWGRKITPVTEDEMRLVAKSAFAEACVSYQIAPAVRHVIAGTTHKRAGAKILAGYMAKHGLVLMGKLPGLPGAGHEGFHGIGALAWDEAQDSTREDLTFVRSLSPARTFVVGDARQSIYGWRGADSEVLLEGVAPEKGKTFYLNINFRSVPEIVKWANSTVTGRWFPQIQPWRNAPDSPRPTHWSECDFILARSNREVGQIARWFEEQGLPCQPVGPAFDRYSSEGWEKAGALARFVLNSRVAFLADVAREFGLKAGRRYTMAEIGERVGLPADDPALTRSPWGFMVWKASRGVQDMITDGNGPKIMTVHAAKGLEADSVCIFNNVGVKKAPGIDSLRTPEEQDNILYVAGTRARDWLMFAGPEDLEA